MTTQVTTETPLIMVDGERILIRRPHDNDYAEFGILGEDIQIPNIGTVKVSGDKEDGYTVSADIVSSDPQHQSNHKPSVKLPAGNCHFALAIDMHVMDVEKREAGEIEEAVAS